MEIFDRESTKELIEGFVLIIHRTVLKEIGIEKVIDDIKKDNGEEKVTIEVQIPSSLLKEIEEDFVGMDLASKLSIILAYGVAVRRFEKNVKNYELAIKKRE
ncbi:hypothetical protein DRN98_04265 [Methanosarcinales archaeon]|uniref:Uncharacterized protein n=1 Tax=Candidatus Syntropharchaeum caldarium TaxID=1838285 RepID=A0A1F2P8Q5_9EURY|nr:MAG: hypothetical protein SCAL_001003 [Candidatus Syntrophoarchaeum caldarius]RLG33185.1 MAG: hypothetical protein DRN98_04265 [Methanosarcinales archaeon]